MMRTEPVTGADAEKLLEIYAPYVENTAISFEYAVPTAEEFADRIETETAKYPYIKAVDESGNIFGYAYACSFKSRPAYARAVETSIYVRQDSRRRGTGRLLYEELERLLKDMGILNMNACIVYPREGRDDERVTKDSVRFHEKMGFSQAGHFHDIGYIFDKWYDVIWMEKSIGMHTTGQKFNIK